MKVECREKLINHIMFPKGIVKVYHLIFIILAIVIVYLFVLFTGGTKYVYSHTMYIPIILASISFGVTGGITVGLIAGILLGPLMPLDTITGEHQAFMNWFYRLIIFIVIGLISGLSFNAFRKSMQKIIKLVSFNQETDIPNVSLLNRYFLANKTDIKYLLTVVINNNENIIDLFSRKHYIIVLTNLYQRIKAVLPKETQIFQAESNKLWICLASINIDYFIEKITSSLNDNFLIDNIPIYVEISIGIVKFEKHDLIEEFKNSDAASTYAHKLNLQYLYYNPKYTVVSKNIELLGQFRDALYKEQLEVYYQPKVDLLTNKPIGLEALLRWTHPEKGPIAPLDIIPLVEETHLINPLTDLVLKRSLQTLVELQYVGIYTTVSVNVSAKNLHQPQFFASIIDLIKKHDVNPSSLELELTESVLMENINANSLILDELKRSQIRLSIDDYGTGYSSLSYLNQLPIKIVKIDKYFIMNMLNDDGLKNIVKSTIDLIHKLGMKVVAEGVESKLIAESLVKMNCDMGQGYYFAKPMNKKALFNWFLNNNLD